MSHRFDSPADFAPAASWETLRLRARLLREVRRFFDDRGFLEVETPLLSADTVIDRHIEPVPVAIAAGSRVDRRMWLQTSPEFAMKRLLASGAEAIYQVTRAFRDAEQGPFHNPEFTIVEWYRAGDDLLRGMDLLDQFCQVVLGWGRAERLSFEEAFRRHAGVDPHLAPVEQLAGLAQALGVVAPGDSGVTSAGAWRRDDLVQLLLVELVEPQLDRSRPTILFDYPAEQAGLAEISEGPRRRARRFELYHGAVELANGYQELCDPDELAERNAAINSLRAGDGKQRLPESSRLLAAMRHGLPPSAGVALGFDRLVMLAAGASRIDEVLAFPVERA